MKTFIAIVLGVLCCTVANTQSIDALISKYKHEERVSKMSMQSEVMRLFAENYQQRKIIDKIDKLDVFLFDKDINLSDKEISTVRAELKSKKYDLLVNARDKDLNLEIYVQDKNERIKKLFMLLLRGEDQQVIADMKCDLSYKDFQNLKLDFLGSENLQKIGQSFK